MYYAGSEDAYKDLMSLSPDSDEMFTLVNELLPPGDDE
jgi:hypothetical protein